MFVLALLASIVASQSIITGEEHLAAALGTQCLTPGYWSSSLHMHPSCKLSNAREGLGIAVACLERALKSGLYAAAFLAPAAPGLPASVGQLTHRGACRHLLNHLAVHDAELLPARARRAHLQRGARADLHP